MDGQQRLTSLYAVLRSQKVITKEFKESHIKIGFRPRDAHFEVTDAAIERDPEYIPDISKLWSKDTTHIRFIRDFMAELRKSREVSREEEAQIEVNIDHLFDVQSYPFTAMEISSSINEEQVSDIFVRINSKGVTLRQADFILTLLSVFWDEGRAVLEKFCRDCRQPATDGQPSPYNNFMQPEPDQILRAAVGYGFKRGRMQYVYSILRGKDLETGEFSDARREEQFAVLKKAQENTLNLTNWHEFHKVLIRAGFRNKNMITSDMGLLYAYTMYLIGRHDYGIDHSKLRDILAKWFFMTSLTARYSASPETTMEADLTRFRNVKDAGEFIQILEQAIKNALTEDYWNTYLVSALETSSARTPVLFAYYAALNLLDAKVLFSKMKVSELLDPALRPQKSSTERHHLFPKGYLKRIGITEIRDTNQLANYALVEWGDNIDISDQSPEEYFPELMQRFPTGELSKMMEWHALPEEWISMDYKEFLKKRRMLIAKVIRKGFEKLSVQEL